MKEWQIPTSDRCAAGDIEALAIGILKKLYLGHALSCTSRKSSDEPKSLVDLRAKTQGAVGK